MVSKEREIKEIVWSNKNLGKITPSVILSNSDNFESENDIRRVVFNSDSLYITDEDEIKYDANA